MSIIVHDYSVNNNTVVSGVWAKKVCNFGFYDKSRIKKQKNEWHTLMTGLV